MGGQAHHAVNGLALCAGAGGLEIGIGLAESGYKTVCYVEGEAYAAAILVARMADQALDAAPIWSDLKTFDGKPWRGVVDIITAGFPCQPVSVAGKRLAQADERWLWPDCARIIREVRPRFVFLENVAGILAAGAGDVLGGLAGLGFDAEWGVFRASDVGAPHRRARWFCLANANGQERSTDRRKSNARPDRGHDAAGRSAGLATVDGARLQGSGQAPFPPGPGGAWHQWLAENPNTEPAVRRGADGLADRVDRLRAGGNGVVPLQAAYAYRALRDRINKRIKPNE